SSDGPRKGFVAALYKNELYSYSSQQQSLRAWGLSQKDVQERVCLIVEPAQSDDVNGVFPSQARATLHAMRKGKQTELPWDQWREEFRDNMPQEIIAVLSESAKDDEALDEKLLEIDHRLKERYDSG